MKSIIAAIAAFAIAAVSAQTTPVSLTSPLTGTVYTAGSNAIITWINPTVATISQIELVKGPSSALQPVLTVTTNVDANAMTYTWAIPADTAAGTDCKYKYFSLEENFSGVLVVKKKIFIVPFLFL